MAIAKISYVAHVPGHKNSKGEAAPWVIKDHKDDHIISSFSSESEAKAGLQNMHAHEGSLKTASPALDDFTKAYLEAALWSTTDDNDTPLDANYYFDDIAPATLNAMVQDCQKFQQDNAQLLEENDDKHGGHDFWLTRNGHGAGFWDGDWPMNGDKLTFEAKKYGEAELYVGDDGYIYQSGKEQGGPIPPKEDFQTSEYDNNLMKSMGVSASLGVLPAIKSKLLMKKEPKLSFAFDNSVRKYDYEANGNEAVLVSPSHTTKVLQGEEARSFWAVLDGIEEHVLDNKEHDAQVQALVKSYFDKDLKAASQKYAIQVDASNLKKASVTFISKVHLSAGNIEKMRFTSRWAKAKTFTASEADAILGQLAGFRMRGALVKVGGRPYVPSPLCEHVQCGGTLDCSAMYNCCDCGDSDGGGCGCPYCWSCNACTACMDDANDETLKVGAQKRCEDCGYPGNLTTDELGATVCEDCLRDRERLDEPVEDEE